MMNGVFLLLGTNQGDRDFNLKNAIGHLEKNGLEIKKISSVYQTAAWGITHQPAFYNQALYTETYYTPEELLKIIKDIEKQMGRITTVKWGERLIDIDILYYEGKVVDNPNLKIPHPHIPERRFTLIPLVEIAPDYIHPILSLSQIKLLQQCTDPLEVTKVQVP